MIDRFIFRFLIWLFLASASSWMLLSMLDKGIRIAETFVADPAFPARYVGFLGLVGVTAAFIAIAAVAISFSVSYRGTGLFRRETGGIRDEVREIREHVGMGNGSL